MTARSHISRRGLLASLAFGTAIGRAQQNDRYGAWSGKRFEASGFFRLEKSGRWWLVSPEGNAYLSLGLNHATTDFLVQPYNRKHWLESFGAASASDPLFVEGFRRRVAEDMKAYGFNALGCHTRTRQYWKAPVWPYVQPFKVVDIDHWRTPVDADFPDVFSTAFENKCRQRASEERLEEFRNDPYLLGYSYTDCPILTELDASARQRVTFGAPRAATSTWPRVLRNLPSGSPGKKVYVELMRERYAGQIYAFNEVYGMSFGSFDAVEEAHNWRPAVERRNANEARDNAAFLERILDRYYQVMAATIRSHDPNHLIFGDKMNGNTDTPDAAIRIAARHNDLTFFQWYAYYGEQHARLDRWSEITGKALLNGDAGLSTPNEHMPHPNGPDAPDQEERARRTLDLGRKAFSRPDFVGWHYCGWMDTWDTMPGKEARQHSGLQDPFGRRYEPIVRAVKTISSEMYDLAAGK